MRAVTPAISRETISSTVALQGSSYSVTRRTFAPVRFSSSRSDSSVEKKSCVVDSTSSPGPSDRPPYIWAIPIVVESVRAYCPGSPPEWSAAARRTASSSSMPPSSVPSVSSASRLRWKSIAASTWAVCGESTNAANCAMAGSSGNCARTDSQSAASKSGIVGAVASVAADSVAVEVVGGGVGSAAGASASQAVSAATERKAGAEEGTAGGCWHPHMVRGLSPGRRGSVP